MNLVYLLFALLLGFTLIFGMRNKGCSQKDHANNHSVPVDSIKRFLTKEEIAVKLFKLAKTSPPSKLSEGAMCYKVASPPNRAEYICPKCGERTVFTESQAYFIYRDLPKCRNYIRNISCIDAKLDESEFCRHCKPGVNHPRLNLIIKYKGDPKEYIKFGILDDDLALLAEFCDDKPVHSDDYDRETPLAKYVGRLQDLLKIKVDIE